MLRLVRRLWRHLTRSRAVGAWLLLLACLVVYATYPDAWPASMVVGQGALIVGSVAVGAIFLPELSSNLWSLRAADIERLVPESKVRGLQRALVEARASDTDWSAAIIAGALDPLLSAEPHNVVQNLSYSVSVHPQTTVEIAGKQVTVTGVETTLRAKRQLPIDSGRKVFWVALARDAQSLRGEFDTVSCLSREIADFNPSLSNSDWADAVRKNCSARVVVDGLSIEAVLEPPGEELASSNEKVVRWFFVSPDLVTAIETRQNILVAFDFFESATCSRFPVIFSAYYLLGGVQVVFRVYGRGDEYRLRHEEFLAFALSSSTDGLGYGRRIDQQVIEKPGVCSQLSLTVGDDALIWPGSGVEIWWEKVEKD